MKNKKGHASEKMQEENRELGRGSAFHWGEKIWLKGIVLGLLRNNSRGRRNKGIRARGSVGQVARKWHAPHPMIKRRRRLKVMRGVIGLKRGFTQGPEGCGEEEKYLPNGGGRKREIQRQIFP